MSTVSIASIPSFETQQHLCEQWSTHVVRVRSASVLLSETDNIHMSNGKHTLGSLRTASALSPETDNFHESSRTCTCLKWDQHLFCHLKQTISMRAVEHTHGQLENSICTIIWNRQFPCERWNMHVGGVRSASVLLSETQKHPYKQWRTPTVQRKQHLFHQLKHKVHVSSEAHICTVHSSLWADSWSFHQSDQQEDILARISMIPKMTMSVLQHLTGTNCNCVVLHCAALCCKNELLTAHIDGSSFLKATNWMMIHAPVRMQNKLTMPTRNRFHTVSLRTHPVTVWGQWDPIIHYKAAGTMMSGTSLNGGFSPPCEDFWGRLHDSFPTCLKWRPACTH